MVLVQVVLSCSGSSCACVSMLWSTGMYSRPVPGHVMSTDGGSVVDKQNGLCVQVPVV